DTLSRQMSLSTETVQVMQAAARENGVSFESMRTGVDRLERSVGEAESGNKKMIDDFKALGVGLVDLSTGKFRPFEDVLHDTARALSDMKDPTQEMVLGVDLMGRGFAQIKPTLDDLGSGWDELKRRAQESGQILSDSAIQADKDIL